MFGKSYEDCYAYYIQNLRRKLEREGVDENTIQNVIDSGYYLVNSNSVYDSLYGNGLSLTIDIIKNGFDTTGINAERVYTIKSLADAYDLLRNRMPGGHFLDEGMMSFRGQVKEYYIERPFPNPFTSINGKERLIIPSAWRPYATIEKLSKRPLSPCRTILNTVYGDDITFHGLDLEQIYSENFKKYGIFTHCDLEDFPEELNKELYRRWREVKLGMYDDVVAVLEQHYGFNTIGLDVTYSLAVAIFFATHKFKINTNGKAEYQKITDYKDSIIYSFVFRNPPVRKTSWMIKDIPIFKQLNPIRPLRQECALPFFHIYEFNGAVGSLHIAMKIDNDFDFTGIPTAVDLFPNAKEDLFYAKLLEMKDTYPDIYGVVPEYIY